MNRQGTHTVVTKLPDCDTCKIAFRLPDLSIKAAYDAKTVDCPWAYMCEGCYPLYRMHDELGVGLGKKLVLEEVKMDDN